MNESAILSLGVYNSSSGPVVLLEVRFELLGFLLYLSESLGSRVEVRGVFRSWPRIPGIGVDLRIGQAWS